MTRARDLCVGTLDTIVERLGLAEDVGDSGASPRFSLAGGFGPIGVCRTFRQPGTADDSSITLSYIAMTVDPIGLDSHMLYAHTPPSSAIPHFTLDSISHGEDFAFHLDLPPRVDQGANLRYLDFCYSELTDVRARTLMIPGLTTAQISPRQWAIMSAWMLVQRADRSAFEAVFAPVSEYCDHWLALVNSGVVGEVLDGPAADPAERAARDLRNRAAVFSPEVDPVWLQVDRLLGPEMSGRLQQLLRTPGAR